MKQFNNDVLQWKNYDFVVVNDELENCYNKINNYINFKKDNLEFVGFDRESIKKHVENLLN